MKTKLTKFFLSHPKPTPTPQYLKKKNKEKLLQGGYTRGLKDAHF